MDEFTAWLNSVCFQKPTPEALDLAKDAWKAALKSKRDGGCSDGVMLYGQATIVEIDQAFTEALLCNADILNCVTTKNRLTELRNSRITWIGRDEHSLRFKIDAFLGTHK